MTGTTIGNSAEAIPGRSAGPAIPPISRCMLWRTSKGYYLQLAGSAWTRTIETVIFFLALHRAGLPVTILDVDILKERLTGTEKIGVVPEGIFPDYCQSLFQSEKIIAFMNLPYENREEFAKRCVWQPVAPVRLKELRRDFGRSEVLRVQLYRVSQLTLYRGPSRSRPAIA